MIDLCIPGVRLKSVRRRADAAIGIVRVAGLAVSDVLRKHDRGEVTDRRLVSHDLIRNPVSDGGQRGPTMDLVDHHLHIERVARVRISRLRVVAEDAERRLAAGPAMLGERVVALVAG